MYGSFILGPLPDLPEPSLKSADHSITMVPSGLVLFTLDNYYLVCILR